MNTVEKMGLIWETDIGLSVLGNFNLWFMGSKVTVRLSSELTSELMLQAHGWFGQGWGH